MDRVVALLASGLACKDACEAAGLSRHTPHLWFGGVAGEEELCAKFRREWLAAKDVGARKPSPP